MQYWTGPTKPVFGCMPQFHQIPKENSVIDGAFESTADLPYMKTRNNSPVSPIISSEGQQSRTFKSIFENIALIFCHPFWASFKCTAIVAGRRTFVLHNLNLALQKFFFEFISVQTHIQTAEHMQQLWKTESQNSKIQQVNEARLTLRKKTPFFDSAARLSYHVSPCPPHLQLFQRNLKSVKKRLWQNALDIF